MKESAATGTESAGEWRPPARRRWRERDARAMARALEASGETKTAFARRHGLGPERVRRWLAQLAERDRLHEPVEFAPVRLIERAPERRGAVEIVIGVRLVRVGAGFCPETLRQVLAALDEAAC